MSSKEKILIFISLGLLIALSTSIYIYTQRPSQLISKDIKNDSAELIIVDDDIEIIDDDSNNPKFIGVHIGGQVKNPGFIWIENGKRLYDAIQEVGGPSEEAELDAVNLSHKLLDEEKIYIPKKGEVGDIYSENLEAFTDSTRKVKININKASESDLTSLPGIGPVLAQRILDYRNDKGPFKTIDNLKNVTGIGDKRFDDIKDLIIVK